MVCESLVNWLCRQLSEETSQNPGAGIKCSALKGDIHPATPSSSLFIVLKILSQNCGHIRNIRYRLVSLMAFRSSVFNKTLLTKAQWSSAMRSSHPDPGTEKGHW